MTPVEAVARAVEVVVTPVEAVARAVVRAAVMVPVGVVPVAAAAGVAAAVLAPAEARAALAEAQVVAAAEARAALAEARVVAAAEARAALAEAQVIAAAEARAAAAVVPAGSRWAVPRVKDPRRPLLRRTRPRQSPGPGVPTGTARNDAGSFEDRGSWATRVPLCPIDCAYAAPRCVHRPLHRRQGSHPLAANTGDNAVAHSELLRPDRDPHDRNISYSDMRFHSVHNWYHIIFDMKRDSCGWASPTRQLPGPWRGAPRGRRARVAPCGAGARFAI